MKFKLTPLAIDLIWSMREGEETKVPPRFLVLGIRRDGWPFTGTGKTMEIWKERDQKVILAMFTLRC